MRFLVLGCTGMAGHMISAYLLENGHEVTGTYRKQSPVLSALADMGLNLLKLDVSVPGAIFKTVPADQFDVIVNCIGLLNKACDAKPALAVRLNSLLPHLLEAATANTNCKIIHLSTDCVFAGNTGPYSEDSEPDGQSIYDLTKAAGELRNQKDVTLRQSIVGPDPDQKGIGLLNWFMGQGGIIQGYSGAMWTGLTTFELARAVEECASETVSGLVNMVPSANISKYNLLRLFNHYLRSDAVTIEKNDAVAVDKTLVRNNQAFSFQPKGYEDQISDLSLWIRSHASLYPHYAANLN